MADMSSRKLMSLKLEIAIKKVSLQSKKIEQSEYNMSYPNNIKFAHEK